jgi:hypothetical protein
MSNFELFRHMEWRPRCCSALGQVSVGTAESRDSRAMLRPMD